jgi:hypothetical protein
VEIFLNFFLSLLVSVAATGSNGRVVEPLSRHPEAKGSSPATGTRREKNSEKKNIFNLFLSPGASGDDS